MTQIGILGFLSGFLSLDSDKNLTLKTIVLSMIYMDICSSLGRFCPLPGLPLFRGDSALYS